MGEGEDDNMQGYAFIEKVETSKQTQILTPMKLDFPDNAVTAILGPSGSGKTTLLSVLTDSLEPNVTARASIHLPGVAAFVPQDDRLHGFYTPHTYLWHYARLTGQTVGRSQEETQAKIDELLAQVGLTEAKDTIVGDVFLKGLSGGQQRRLSVALEAFSAPQNFYLDEPTSGLDAESALQIMLFLKEYVRAAPNRRVILTIHQPSSFIWQTIDNVVLLSKGQVIYNGPRANMESFFAAANCRTPEGWNPADHYVTVVNDEFRDHQLSVDEWAQKFKLWTTEAEEEPSQQQQRMQRTPSMTKAQEAGEMKTHRNASGLRVAAELTHRYFLNLAFNPGILGTRIAMYAMLGLMVGALFWNLGHRNDFESIQSRTAVLFYCVAFFIFMSVAVLPFTVMERAIVDKEVHNKYYHPILYQVSQGIASIPGTALLAFLVTLIIITMTKMNAPYWYYLNMFLALVVAEALAQLISHVVPHFVIGMAVVAGMYGFFMLFQGFMLVPSQFPKWLRWVYNVAFHTYSWRTFMVSEFRGSPYEYVGNEAFTSGEDVLVFY